MGCGPYEQAHGYVKQSIRQATSALYLFCIKMSTTSPKNMLVATGLNDGSVYEVTLTLKLKRNQRILFLEF